MNLRTKKICRTGVGLGGSQTGSAQAIILMQQQAGLILKTCVKVDTPHFPERFQCLLSKQINIRV